AVIETIKSLDHEVTLVTAEPTDWGKVEKIIGTTIRPDKEVCLLPFRVRAFGIYMRLLESLKILLGKKRYDLIVNTHGDVLPISSDIIYMHFPTFAILKEPPVNIKYSKSFFWRFYFCPYEIVQAHLVKKMMWKELLTNSEYSREVIKKYIGTDAIVLPPPVDVNDFLKASKSKNREDRVVLCGRYSPEKNYEFALRVAEHLPHVEFTIIGASSGKVSSAYYRKLARLIVERKLRNVELLRDVPKDEQLKLYSKSKVFMHAMINEHFGIAIVEGMASGLVPVVHRSGGPWCDIINRGLYGLGYSSLEEAVEATEEALEGYWNFREKAIERSLMYDKKKFINDFAKIINVVKSL
ncbi:MAG: glycosyltransferase, partial [Nitrososphaerota archaeon]|nr:glycosyltransferase [Nitrososphaerota archaeon]